MIAYLVRRFLYVIPLVLGVSLFVFLVFDSGILGDRAASQLGKHASPAALARLRHDLGLDLPFLERLWNYAKDVFTLDFGRSWSTKIPITEIVAKSLWPSISLTLPAFAISTLLAVSLSVLCAAFRGGKLDKTLLIGAVALMSVSSLVYIIFGQYFLSFEAGLFPISGYTRGPGALEYLALPVLIFVFLNIAPDLRFYRTAMLEEVRQDYVRTARAKGLAESRVLFAHVLRNGLIPVVTQVVVSIPFLFLGSILLERFFGIPGIGGVVIQAIEKTDIPVIRALTVVFALVVVVANLATDVAYTLIDPRVRLG